MHVNWNPSHQYRLIFTGDAGGHLTGAALGLTGPADVLTALPADAAAHLSGPGRLIVFDNSNYPSESSRTADATFDNFAADVPEPGTAVVAVGAMRFALRRPRRDPPAVGHGRSHGPTRPEAVVS